MGAVTLKDIANLVGVSVNTVSRGLKDKPDIGLKTRQRIKEAAAALGYRPNLNARSLVLQKTSTIGVAVTEMDNPVRMEFCEKLRVRAERDGYRLLTTSLAQDNGCNWCAGNIECIEDLLARRVDGLIIGAIWGLTGEQPLGPILQECRQTETPVVVFGTPETELADCIEIDFFNSGYRLTEYLLNRKYSSIVYFGEPDDKRAGGYEKAMKNHGAEKNIQIWPHTANRLEAGKYAMDAYLKQSGGPPQAIVASNDLGAIGIISSLKKHGLRVPQDCAVAGFDNIAIGEFIDPPLTSIGFDNNTFADAVWNMMIRRLRKLETGPAQKITLNQELVIRESC